MRKGLSLCLAVLLIFAGSGLIYAGIGGSKHDWSASGPAPGGKAWRQKETQICRPCHVPHQLTLQPMTQLRLLWAQTANWSQAITLWYQTELWHTEGSVTAVGALPAFGIFEDGRSNASIRFCLSCHSDLAFLLGGNQYTFDTVTAVSLNLRSDHPINVELVAKDGSIRTPNVATVKLVGGRVVCRSCHNPHNEAGYGAKLLAHTMSGSELCIACHPK